MSVVARINYLERIRDYFGDSFLADLEKFKVREDYSDAKIYESIGNILKDDLLEDPVQARAFAEFLLSEKFLKVLRAQTDRDLREGNVRGLEFMVKYAIACVSYCADKRIIQSNRDRLLKRSSDILCECTNIMLDDSKYDIDDEAKKIIASHLEQGFSALNNSSWDRLEKVRDTGDEAFVDMSRGSSFKFFDSVKLLGERYSIDPKLYALALAISAEITAKSAPFLSLMDSVTALKNNLGKYLSPKGVLEERFILAFKSIDENAMVSAKDVINILQGSAKCKRKGLLPNSWGRSEEKKVEKLVRNSLKEGSIAAEEVGQIYAEAIKAKREGGNDKPSDKLCTFLHSISETDRLFTSLPSVQRGSAAVASVSSGLRFSADVSGRVGDERLTFSNPAYSGSQSARNPADASASGVTAVVSTSLDDKIISVTNPIRPDTANTALKSPRAIGVRGIFHRGKE